MLMAYHGCEVRACRTGLGWFGTYFGRDGLRHATGNVDTAERALEMARDQIDEGEQADAAACQPPSARD